MCMGTGLFSNGQLELCENLSAHPTCASPRNLGPFTTKSRL